MIKKFTSLLCVCVVMFSFFIGVLFVKAEDPNKTTTTGSTTTTTTGSSTSTSTTDPSATETTDTTKPVKYSFDYEYDDRNKTMKVTYTPTTPKITRYELFGISHTIMAEEGKGIDVVLGDEDPGQYPIKFYTEETGWFAADRYVEILSKTGDKIKTKMDLTVTYDRATIHITDEYGKNIPNYPIDFYQDGEEIKTVKTSSKGKVTVVFEYDAKEIKFVAQDHSTASQDHSTASQRILHYSGTEKVHKISSGESTTTDPSVDDSKPTESYTTGRPPSRVTTTTRTQKTVKPKPQKSSYVFGAKTTDVKGKKFVLGTLYDTTLLTLFDRKESIFNTSSRLFINKDVVDFEMPDSNMLMMKADASKVSITNQMISSYISGKSKLSMFHADETMRVAMDLSLVIANPKTKEFQSVNDGLDMKKADIEVQLPVPNSMKNSEKYEVYVAKIDNNDEGDFIKEVIKLTVQEDIIKFSLNEFGTYALLGFYFPDGIRPKNTVPTLVVLIISLGVAMLAGAGVLLWYFFLRKTRVAENGIEGMESQQEYFDKTLLKEDTQELDIPPNDRAGPEKNNDNSVSLGSFLDDFDDEK